MPCCEKEKALSHFLSYPEAFALELYMFEQILGEPQVNGMRVCLYHEIALSLACWVLVFIFSHFYHCLLAFPSVQSPHSLQENNEIFLCCAFTGAEILKWHTVYVEMHTSVSMTML